MIDFTAFHTKRVFGALSETSPMVSGKGRTDEATKSLHGPADAAVQGGGSPGGKGSYLMDKPEEGQWSRFRGDMGANGGVENDNVGRHPAVTLPV